MSSPDAAALVVEYLRAQDHLAGVTVASGRPDDPAAQTPLPLVEQIDELPRSRMPWARTRRMRIGLKAWVGPEAAEALQLLRKALAALYAARAVALPDGGRIDSAPTSIELATPSAPSAAATAAVCACDVAGAAPPMTPALRPVGL